MKGQCIGILLISLAWAGCQSPTLVDDVPLPNVRPKVVVYSVLTPADSIEVQVSWAYPIQSGKTLEQAGIRSARVVLYHQQDSIALQPTKVSGRYAGLQKRFPIQIGQTYRLQVNVADQPTLTATCSVPSREASFERITPLPIANGEWQILKEWQDVSTTNDSLNYAIAEYSSFESEYSSYPLVAQKLYDLRTIKRERSLLYDDTTIYHDPELLKQYNTPYTYYLLTLDINLTRFLKMSLQMKDALDNDKSTFLFGFRGIVPEFTNIQNGLGVFGAYVSTKSKPVFLR